MKRNPLSLSVTVLAASLFQIVACGGPTTPQLDPVTVRVSGRATTAHDGSPVQGVIVEVYEVRPAAEPNILVESTTTDVDGRYDLSFLNPCDGTSFDLRGLAPPGYAPSVLRRASWLPTGFSWRELCEDPERTADMVFTALG
jgi:hypothetical protein